MILVFHEHCIFRVFSEIGGSLCDMFFTIHENRDNESISSWFWFVFQELNTSSFGSFQSTSFSGPIKTQNKLFKRRSCIRDFENNSKYSFDVNLRVWGFYFCIKSHPIVFKTPLSLQIPSIKWVRFLHFNVIYEINYVAA